MGERKKKAPRRGFSYSSSSMSLSIASIRRLILCLAETSSYVLIGRFSSSLSAIREASSTLYVSSSWCAISIIVLVFSISSFLSCPLAGAVIFYSAPESISAATNPMASVIMNAMTQIVINISIVPFPGSPGFPGDFLIYFGGKVFVFLCDVCG